MIPWESRRRHASFSRWLVFLAAGAVFCLSLTAQALEWPKKTTYFLNDYAHLLSTEDADAINAELRDYQKRSGNQVVVAIFTSLDGESLEDVSIDIARSWEIGTKGKDNGALLSIFVQDRKTRIETGYGAETQLTDAVSSRILRNTLAPAFREEKYAEGIRASIAAIESVLEGRAPPAAARKKSSKAPPPGVIIFLVFVFFIVLSRILQNAARRPATISRRRALRRIPWWWWMGGGGGGFGGGGFGGGTFGGGGWGGGGGGGGGGFSGGGGSFGGGGASGSW